MKVLIGIVAGIALALPCFGATYYYIGSGSDWNTATNWSETSGGAGGAGIPGSGDTAIFDANSGDCTCDANVTVARLYLTNGFANVLDMNDRNLDTEYSSGNGIVQIKAGEIRLGSGTHTIRGDWDYDGATIRPETSWFVLYAPSSAQIDVYGDFTLYNFRITNNQSGSSNKRSDIHGTITVTGTFNPIGYGTGDWHHNVYGNGEIHAQGTIQGHSSRYISGNLDLVINGSGTQAQNGLIWIAGNYEVNKASGTLVCSGTQVFGKKYDKARTFTFNSPTDFTNNATTVDFWISGSYADRTIAGTSDPHFHNLDINGDGGTGWAEMELSGKTVTVHGNCYIRLDPGGGHARRINNGTLDVKGNLTLNLPNNGGNARGSAIVRMSGPANRTINGDGTAKYWNDLVIAKSDGAMVTLVDDLGTRGAGADIAVQSGTLDLAGYNIRADGVLDIDDRLRLRGNEAITGTMNLDMTSSAVEFAAGYGDLYLSSFPATEFFNLTVGGNRTNYFAASTLYTVNGTLGSNGSRAAPAVLRSTSDGTQWQLNLVSGRSTLASTVNVKDSDASPGQTVWAMGSVDSGNNLNWDFYVASFLIVK